MKIQIRRAVATAALMPCACLPVLHAQAQSPPPSASLPDVVITGNPLRSSAFTQPSSVLAGEELVRRRGATLGDTLDTLPGVSQTAFGPNSSRPTIRGLDGERVRVINNAGGSLDASTLSFDHAVPIDPLVVERLEVLRGPAALLYGGSAIGGVVNALDNRIPRRVQQGLAGSTEVRLGGADRGRSAAALLDVGNGRLAGHVDVFGRRSDDLRVAPFTPTAGDGSTGDRTDRIGNSAGRAEGASAGVSLTDADGYLGVSTDTYRSRYGIVVEPDVFIRMQRDHAALAGERRQLGGPIKALRGSWNHTRYRHEEVEGSGEIGTTFRNQGDELRFEAEHAPWGALRGVVGVQADRFDFSALGEEAFVPSTRTERSAAFVVEEFTGPFGTTRAGLRLERARMASEGDGPGTDPVEARFGAAAQRRFNLTSGSVSQVLPVRRSDGSTLEWQASLSHSERAPTTFELFANGLHAATAAFERGDPGLGVERGQNLELALAGASGPNRWRAGLWASRFTRYIALDATGATVDVPGEDGSVETVPEFQFRAVPARLHGAELEGRWRALERPWTIDLTGLADWVRGRNASTGEPLPRLAPMRLTVGAEATAGAWVLRAEVRHAAAQRRFSTGDRETAGYTLLNLGVRHRIQIDGVQALWFASLDNATHALAFNAATVPTARGLSPLPGRSLRTGLRVDF